MYAICIIVSQHSIQCKNGKKSVNKLVIDLPICIVSIGIGRRIEFEQKESDDAEHKYLLDNQISEMETQPSTQIYMQRFNSTFLHVYAFSI